MRDLELRGKWLADGEPGEDCHVTPVDDLRRHDRSRMCWCRPVIDGRLIVHHSFDGRELREGDIDPRYREVIN